MIPSSLGPGTVGRPGFDALGFDPAPGNLGRIEALHSQYAQVGESLGQAHQVLAAVGTNSGFWRGDAADAFRTKVGDLPGYLDDAHRSLDAAAAALQGWHTDLSSMQHTAADLELQANKARRAVEDAESNPDLGLAGQYFTDDESLREAERRLEAALWNVQFVVPQPSSRVVIVLDVSTGSEQAWPIVVKIAAGMAHSMRLTHAN